MALDPGAELRLLPENATAKRTDPRILCYHTIVGSADSAYGYFLRSTNLESTFIVPKQGRRWQLMDTNRRADCNYFANDWVISVETGDNGAPETDPWTDSQLSELIAVGRWVLAAHPKVRPVLCTAWDGTGIGWHAMWGAPSNWTPSRGKTCPGRTRIAQFQRVILPALTSGAPAPRPVPPPPVGPTVLRRGDSGNAVVALQRELNRLGADLNPDGDFGPATETAVKTLQRNAGLTADGVYGPATIRALWLAVAALDKPTPTPPPRPKDPLMALSDAEQGELLKAARATHMLAQAALNEAKAAHEDAKQARAGALTAIAEMRKLTELIPAIHLLTTAVNDTVNAPDTPEAKRPIRARPAKKAETPD